MNVARDLPGSSMEPRPQLAPGDGVDARATAGLVLGIVSVVASFVPLLGFPVAVVGLVVSARGLRSRKRRHALVGIALCLIGLVLAVATSPIGPYRRVNGGPITLADRFVPEFIASEAAASEPEAPGAKPRSRSRASAAGSGHANR